MRIGIDARLWNESGVGRYIRNLITNLIILDSKNDYTLFIKDSDSENIKYHPPAGGSNINNKNNWRIIETNIRWHSLEEQIKFPSLLNRECLDLVHFPYFSVPIFYNKPFVITIHDLILDHFPTGRASTLPLPIYKIKQLGYKFVIKQVVRKAEKIITVSNATKDEIVDHFKVDEDKVVVTYEGIDKKLSSKLKVQSSKLKNKNYFLYVGNAYPHKNLVRMLEAFSNFKFRPPAGGSNFKLIMVGKEDFFYKKLKEKAKQMGLGESVVFLHEVKDEELVWLYRNAKALIMPSLMEGFGLPVLEAMANKCLVLCSDIPVFREICKDAALYFDPYDVNNLLEKMQEVSNNNTYYYSDKIKKGYKRVEEFSFEKMAKETLRIYESTSSVSLE